MKNKLLLAFFFALFMIVGLQVQARRYKAAVGLRLGYPTSVSYKFHLNESNAVEVYAGTRRSAGYSWYNISAAYLVHKPLPIEDVEGFRWYYGGGGSVFFWSFNNSFLNGNNATTTFGVQGYLGLEYTFEDTPINITLDWVPTFFFNGFGSGLGGGYGTLGVRYVLGE